MKPNNSFSKILLFALVALIPIGTRVLARQFTPGFHEYETVFVYASDLILIAFLVFARKAIGLPAAVFKIFFIAFLALSALGAFFAPSPALAIYGTLRILLLVLLSAAVGSLARERSIFEKVLAIIVIMSVLESALGIFQFKTQGNLGLQAFGESPFGQKIEGTSRVVIGGIHLVRAYGTFPHPNVLGAFLLLGLLGLFHFYLHGSTFPRRLLISAGIFLVSTGLILTFSRSVWLVAFMGTVPFVLYGLYRERALAGDGNARSSPWRLSKFWFEDRTAPVPHAHVTERRERSLKLLVVLLAINYFIFAVFGWAVFPRIELSTSEPAVFYRFTYNRLGLELIGERPFGVGVGNQVLYAYEKGLYQENGLSSEWQWQPIHNLYLLMASEIGVLGLGVFLLLVVFVFLRLRGSLPLEKLTVIVLLGSVLVLGFFDHYFWTLEQGRLILWLVIGLALGFGYNEEKRLV